MIDVSRYMSRDLPTCWDLVMAVYRDEFGIELPTYRGTRIGQVEKEEIARVIEEEMPTWLKTDRPTSGDLILLRLFGLPTHIGVVTKPGWMLHIPRNGLVCQERFTKPIWNRRIQAYYRHRTRAL